MFSRNFVAFAGVAAFATVARAGTLSFDYQLDPGPIVIDAIWTASSTPTPLAYVVSSYTDIPVSNGTFEFGALGGPLTSGSFSDVTFYNAGFSGPLGPGGFLASFVGDFGPQIYAGNEGTPVFSTGVYPLAFGTLTVTSAPEPATWALMLIGFGAAGARLRGSRRQRVGA